MKNQEQENIINKLYKSQQQSNHLKMINVGLNLLTVLLMVVNLFLSKQRKVPIAVRLMRNKGIREKAKIDQETILKEAAYESQVIKLENGLDFSLVSDPFRESKRENKLDILSEEVISKEKEIISDQIDLKSVSNNVSNKFTSSLDKAKKK